MGGKPPGVSGRGDVRPRGEIFVSGFKYLCSDTKVTHLRKPFCAKQSDQCPDLRDQVGEFVRWQKLESECHEEPSEG